MRQRIAEVEVKIKDKLRGNIFLCALPYSILISGLTIIGLFGGFFAGGISGSDTVAFLLALIASFAGFFTGILVTCIIVKDKPLPRH